MELKELFARAELTQNVYALRIMDHLVEIFGSVDRFNEICAAEREGRYVVLPCKIGKDVWTIVNCESIMKHCDNDYYDGTGAVTCPFENECKNEECDESNQTIAHTCVTGFWQDKDGTWCAFLEDICENVALTAFGKTVFLTPGEAQAALEKEASDAKAD